MIKKYTRPTTKRTTKQTWTRREASSGRFTSQKRSHVPAPGHALRVMTADRLYPKSRIAPEGVTAEETNALIRRWREEE